VESLDAMTDLSVELRNELSKRWQTRALDVASHQRSSDGTQKLALRTLDGEIIEAVIIPEARRNTLCVSTQVGCPLACSFCATGTLGLRRNLSTAEIVDQLCRAQEILEDGQRITNIVFMGMGEPLLNLPAVAEAIQIFIHPKAFGMAPRRITVSTSGVLPKLEPLLEIAPINLAVSLHATTDEVRNVLVPLNERFPIDALLDALRSSEHVNRRRPVLIEYTLIAGINDSVDDAERLSKLLRGIPCRINVIPMNPHPSSPYRAPSEAIQDRFTAAVHRNGLRVILRRNRGTDIDAACGQLAARAADEKPGPIDSPAA
jgi:23S rRNA (adenine2503-C2)-methyltransferase